VIPASIVSIRQAHFLHQAVLEGLEQPLDAPLACDFVPRPFDSQILELVRSASALFPRNCSGSVAASRPKMLFLSV